MQRGRARNRGRHCFRALKQGRSRGAIVCNVSRRPLGRRPGPVAVTQATTRGPVCALYEA